MNYDVNKTFRTNVLKRIREQGMKPSEFARKIGMHKSKMQRLCNPEATGSIKLEDAVSVADKLKTTVGVLAESPVNSYIVEMREELTDWFDDHERARAKYKKMFENPDREKRIREYLAYMKKEMSYTDK